MASNKEDATTHLHNFHSERHNKLNFTYRKLPIHFDPFGRCKSSVRQKLAAKVVKTELK